MLHKRCLLVQSFIVINCTLLSAQFAYKNLQKYWYYRKANHHLPNIKSADDVACDGGYSVGELELKLLEKVEELTLHMIELKKENEELKRLIK